MRRYPIDDRIDELKRDIDESYIKLKEEKDEEKIRLLQGYIRNRQMNIIYNIRTKEYLKKIIRNGDESPPKCCCSCLMCKQK